MERNKEDLIEPMEEAFQLLQKVRASGQNSYSMAVNDMEGQPTAFVYSAVDGCQARQALILAAIQWAESVFDDGVTAYQAAITLDDLAEAARIVCQ